MGEQDEEIRRLRAENNAMKELLPAPFDDFKETPLAIALAEVKRLRAALSAALKHCEHSGEGHYELGKRLSAVLTKESVNPEIQLMSKISDEYEAELKKLKESGAVGQESEWAKQHPNGATCGNKWCRCRD